jgi:hypothetical protein
MQLLLSLLPYLVGVVSLIATVGLFAGLSSGLSKLRKRITSCEASVQAEAAQLTNAINDLKRRIGELEKSDSRTCSDLHPAGDLGTGARSKVFKLYKAGQPADDIAQKLRLSRGEVELLIKAQRIVMRPYEVIEAVAGGTSVEKG